MSWRLLFQLVTEEEENVVEEVENVDEKMERRAEKILLGEEVSSSSGEEDKQVEVELKERNYHTDTDSDLVSQTHIKTISRPVWTFLIL